MLIGALIALFVVMSGSHSDATAPQFEQSEKLIKKNVDDPTRRGAALTILRLMQMQENGYEQSRNQTVQTIGSLLDNRRTPVSEIQNAAEPLLTEDRANAQKLLDMRLQLKDILTADEWAKVFPPPGTSVK